MFEVCDRKWRGIGGIPESGLSLREEYAEFDADRIFGTEGVTADEPAECISAEVLQGLKKPTDCSAFGTRCTPENPLGAPMVSSEGACAAYYQYRRHALAAKANRMMPPRNETRLALNCPVPIAARESILLGHGSGGRMSARRFCAISSFRLFKIPCSTGWMTKPSWMSVDRELRLRRTLSS